MAGRSALGIWLFGIEVARVREVRTGKLTVQYTDEARERWGTNVPVLSVSMPLRPERYPPGTATPYLEGLLPEGEARATLEHRFGVRRGDSYGLLAAIGRDCAGAVVIQPTSDPAPTSAVGSVEWIDSSVLSQAVANLPSHPLGAGEHVRVSLAGRQPKLLLVQGAQGAWGIPRDGYPSTHILKPGDVRYPALVANEAFCLRVARFLGLTTVEPTTTTVQGKPVLVVPRYDRVVDGKGHVHRLHQEDMCQALAIDTGSSGAKYEAHGGPSLRQIAGVLDRFGGVIDHLDRLLQVITLTVAVGNADAHGKNLSLLHRGDGVVELAPVYDVLSTIHYPTVSTPDGDRPLSTDLAMRVGGRWSVNEITVTDILAEATSWPYARLRALEQVSATLERLPEAVGAAATATDDLPSAIPERITQRIAALRRGKPAGGRG